MADNRSAEHERAERAEAAIKRVRAALTSFEGRGQIGVLVNNWDVPTAAQVIDAVRTAIDGGAS